MFKKNKPNAPQTSVAPELSILQSKPWQKDNTIPKDIDGPIGMVGPEERRSYYWFAKNAVSDKGCIVDAGAFLGASCYAFAAGSAAAGRRNFEGSAIIHSFDYFSVIDEYVGKSISEQIRPIKLGESYLDIFEKQTQPYADMVQTYPGDFLKQSWDGKPIDLLFIDISKTAALNAHVCSQFMPCLTPGRSVIIHQDYFHCWHPYIHITMEYLREEVTLLDDHITHQSAAWLLSKPIPKEKLARLVAYDFSELERIALLDRLIASASSTIKPMIECVKLWQLTEDKSYAKAQTQLRKIESVYGLFLNTHLWARQALEIERVLPESFRRKGSKMASSIELEKTKGETINTMSDKIRDNKPINLKISFDKIIANYPSFHRDAKGEPWFLGVSGDTLKTFAGYIQPGMRTIETGAGFSSLAFILNGAHHTAICPDDYLEKNMRTWCDEWKIDHSRFTYLTAMSQDVVPGLTEQFDFVFIDGEHAFPMPQIDFYYLARRLKVGGHMAIDDTNIWTGAILVQHLRLDKSWKLVQELDGKTAVFQLLEPFRDKGLWGQPFVLANSRGLPDLFYEPNFAR